MNLNIAILLLVGLSNASASMLRGQETKTDLTKRRQLKKDSSTGSSSTGSSGSGSDNTRSSSSEDDGGASFQVFSQGLLDRCRIFVNGSCGDEDLLNDYLTEMGSGEALCPGTPNNLINYDEVVSGICSNSIGC
eukprot:60700_1